MIVLRYLALLSIAGCMLLSPAKACFDPHRIPLPVLFDTASAEMSDSAKRYAEDLLESLREVNPREITLFGHTDARGGYEYNMRLSERRAKAVANFLMRNGITAKIITIAKGKSEPLQLTDMVQLTRQEIWMLNRRVDWMRGMERLPSTNQTADTRC